MSRPKALCVVGPTASGKSALGIALAIKLNGEIVCMDSMQIYRRMNIGTAKPTPEERRRVPHHLVDIKEPDESYSVAQYAADARRVIEGIHGCGRVPILVGGTGFYLRALTHGLNLGGVPSDPTVRERLKDMAKDARGRKLLHDRLREVDPLSAGRLHENDVTRVSRALEVYELTGVPMSKQEQPAFESPFDFCILGTDMDRELLYRRIDARVDRMVENGLPHEVKTLLDEGISPQAQAMQGIGYKELVPVILGSYPFSNAVFDIKRNSRHYAKRQLTWFKRDETVHWLDMADETITEKALALAGAFLEGNEA